MTTWVNASCLFCSVAHVLSSHSYSRWQCIRKSLRSRERREGRPIRTEMTRGKSTEHIDTNVLFCLCISSNNSKSIRLAHWRIHFLPFSCWEITRTIVKIICCQVKRSSFWLSTDLLFDRFGELITGTEMFLCKYCISLMFILYNAFLNVPLFIWHISDAF